MCIDSRGLNQVTIPNQFPLPRIDDLVDRLQGAKVFTALDMIGAAYHQIKLPAEEFPRTAFRTPFGLYEFKVMTFGFTNAPSVFTAAVKDCLGDLPFVTVYLDDILIFSKDDLEHVAHVEAVLQRLRQHKYFLKLSKCEFFKKEIQYLGHIVGTDGIKPDPKKVQAVADWESPKTVFDVRSFLGFTNYFRRYIDNYATLTLPLLELSGGNISRRKSANTPVLWKTHHQVAFDALKKALISAPTLKLPDLNKPFQVITDASDYALGAILIQDGQPIAYESRKLSSAEQNYHTTDKELLAVVHALSVWRCYLEGSTFKVITDHNPLTYLSTQASLSRRQARWAEKLSAFQFEWEYKPGIDNPADPLSRMCILSVVTRGHFRMPAPQLVRNPTPISSIVTTKDLIKAYRTDPWFSNPDNTSSLRHEDSLWWKGDVLVIPDDPSIRTAILRSCHDAPVTGHFGRTKTLDIVARYFWWPKMRKHVTDHVASCDSCQRVKSSSQKPAGTLRPLPIPGRQWDDVAMDLITDLPPVAEGYDAIIVFTDRLTKMVHLAPCKKTCDAKDTALIFLRTIFRYHGMPNKFTHDRDTRFTSHFWQEFFSLSGVSQAASSAYHPQTDGQSERVNRVVEDYLRHYTDSQQSDWADHLIFAEFAINNSKHESTGFTPFFMNYGFHPTLPQIFAIAPSSAKRARVPAASDLLEIIQKSIASAKVSLEKAQQRQKRYADEHRREVTFAIGDRVLLSTKNLPMRKGYSKKLLPRFIGPFTVTRVINDVSVQLDLPSGLRWHNVFHASLVRHYKEGSNIQAAPIPVVIEGELEWEVESIEAHRPAHRSYEYLVHWKGFSSDEDTWEPESHLRNSPELLSAYRAKHNL